MRRVAYAPDVDLETRLGLRSEGRISSTRRIFVEFSSDRTYIYIIRSSSNFFREIRRIFDEFSTNFT